MLRSFSSFLFALLLSSTNAYTQPGFDNHVTVKHIDKDVHFELFSLNEDNDIIFKDHRADVKIFKVPYQPDLTIYTQSEYINTGLKINIRHQRLMLYLETDTMVVDFNYIGSKPFHFFLSLDSIVFIPGYYTSNLQDSALDNASSNTKEFIARGITPSTINTLKNDVLQQIQIENYGNLLPPNQPPASYFVMEAYHFYAQKDLDAMRSMLDQIALRPLNDILAQERLFLLVKLELYLKNIEAALAAATELVEGYPSKRGYDLKIYIQNSMGLYEASIRDYDFLISNLELNESLESWLLRAEIILDTLEQPERCIADLQPLIDQIPDDYMADQFIISTQYDFLHYTLGRAYYSIGNIPAAIHQWMTASQYGFMHLYHPRKESISEYFNQLIEQDPRPEFYLIRAFFTTRTVRYGSGPDGDWPLNAKNSALYDLDKAEKLKQLRNSVNYLRAFIQLRYEMDREAEAIVKRLKDKGSQDPRVYYLSYEIRKKKGKHVNPYQEDPDIIICRKMQAQWKYPK